MAWQYNFERFATSGAAERRKKETFPIPGDKNEE